MEGFAPNIYYYACECGYGFLCLANTALPAFCPEGFYCTYPWDYHECKEGNYCKEGAVFGTACNLMEACPPGSPTPLASSSGPTLFLAFVGMFFILYHHCGTF